MSGTLRNRHQVLEQNGKDQSIFLQVSELLFTYIYPACVEAMLRRQIQQFSEFGPGQKWHPRVSKGHETQILGQKANVTIAYNFWMVTL